MAGIEDHGTTWKSNAAKETHAELINVANMEKEQLNHRAMASPGLSEYERMVLRIQIADMYHSAIARAYESASDIETKALALHANLAHAMHDLYGVD